RRVLGAEARQADSCLCSEALPFLRHRANSQALGSTPMLQADVANHTALPSMSVAPIRGGEPLDSKTRRRRKYVFTAQIDERIREIYLHHPNAKSRRGIRQLANLVAIPHWALKERARELGLAR